jgi:hypothetical protein
MARKFNELRKKMSPEARARSKAAAKRMIQGARPAGTAKRRRVVTRREVAS